MTTIWCLVQALLRLCRHAACKYALHADVQSLAAAACCLLATCWPIVCNNLILRLHSVTIAKAATCLHSPTIASCWELQEFKVEQQRAADAAAASGSISEDWGLSQVRVLAAELALCSVQMGQVSELHHARQRSRGAGCALAGSPTAGVPEGARVTPPLMRDAVLVHRGHRADRRAGGRAGSRRRRRRRLRRLSVSVQGAARILPGPARAAAGVRRALPGAGLLLAV